MPRMLAKIDFFKIVAARKSAIVFSAMSRQAQEDWLWTHSTARRTSSGALLMCNFSLMWVR